MIYRAALLTMNTKWNKWSQNQITLINKVQNHNHFASMGFTICTANEILRPPTLNLNDEKNLPHK